MTWLWWPFFNPGTLETRKSISQTNCIRGIYKTRLKNFLKCSRSKPETHVNDIPKTWTYKIGSTSFYKFGIIYSKSIAGKFFS